jgi:tetratricopeptide (TPR) repeat protein
MSIRFNLRVRALFLLISAGTLYGQTAKKAAGDADPLRQHYVGAQDLQRAGKLNEAAEQYRAFLADALDELAMGYGLAHDGEHAGPLFDEGLILEPNSPSLFLDYARTALTLGDLARAKRLAKELIQKYPENRVQLAQAHQLLGRTLLKLGNNQEARKELELAVDLDPTFPNGYDLAVACLDLADDKCAVQIFTEMEKSFGDTPQIHLAFGRAYGESDFQARAIPEFRRAIEQDPRLPGVHYLLAAVLLATGGDESHVASAEAELKKELLISPRDSMTYAALGEIEVNRRNYPEAETYLKKAVLLGPQSPDAYLYLGQMYFASNRSAEAETALRRSIQLTTDVSRNRYQVQKAHFLLGRVLMQKGQGDAAHEEMTISRELANKTLAQDKSNLAALTDASGSGDGRAPGADAGAAPRTTAAATDPVALRTIESLKEQLKLPVADSYNNLGAIAATNSNYSGAVKYFERAVAWNPSLDGLDYNWGRAAFAGSQFADAIMPLSRYVKANPDDAGARSVLAISQFMMGNYRGCVDALEPAIGKAELAPQAEYVYAESMVRIGRVASGTERLAALEKAHPEIPDVHRALGEALIQQGSKQKALEELRLAIQLSPNDADSHYDLGKMEFESGDKTAAIPELELATRLSPDREKFHQDLANAYTAALRPADAQKEMATYNLLRARAQGSTSSHPAVAPQP